MSTADDYRKYFNELIKQFGIGRNTVREALRILETSGLVKSEAGFPH